MKPLNLKQNKSYKLIQFKDNTWVRVEFQNETIGLCMDLTTSFQVVYQHYGKCDRLSIKDFK